MRNLSIILVLCLVAGAAAALYFHWVNISRKDTDEGKTEVRLTVDKNKAKEDLNAAKEKVKSGASNLQTQAKEGVSRGDKDQSVKGTIRGIDPEKGLLTVTSSSSDEVKVRVVTSTQIHIGDKPGKIMDIKPGDRAVVTYESQKGEQVAKTVTIESGT